MYNKMILCAVIIHFLSAVCGAIENPNVGSPFKQRNAPAHSGQRQRLITSGNPYGRTGNDIVTGNVGGGKHFRGVVPYGSSYYSGAFTNSPGSGSVNRFIRRSANPIANDRNPGQAQTYYDPRRSVSSMRRPDGNSGLTNPQLSGQGRTNYYIIPNPERMTAIPQYQRPLSANNMDLEQILTRQEELRKQAQKQDKQTEAESSKQKGFFDDILLDNLDPSKSDSIQQDVEAKPTTPPDDVLSELQAENQEVNDEQALQEQEPDTLPEILSPRSKYLPELDLKSLDAEEGRKILGKHKTFASLAEEKFDRFMDAGERFVKNGQFYKAADTYALAIIWKPKDARGYLGQSFSLFAAGEYMSSAYYLSRAFELDPTVATKKYNAAEFVGKRDLFENRVLELSTWQERSKSGELAFLLAYISYQDNKTARAAGQIQKAKEAMPDSSAVKHLKNIIDPEEVLK
ncbi:MAG: tetratricopeptide repeat protein [Planctomycetota bacterium]|jgi:hypothetical protein